VQSLQRKVTYRVVAPCVWVIVKLLVSFWCTRVKSLHSWGPHLASRNTALSHGVNAFRYLKVFRGVNRQCDGRTEGQMDRWPLAISRSNIVRHALMTVSRQHDANITQLNVEHTRIRGWTLFVRMESYILALYYIGVHACSCHAQRSQWKISYGCHALRLGCS